MSMATWELQQARAELHQLLDEDEADVRKGDRGVTVGAVRKLLERR